VERVRLKGAVRRVLSRPIPVYIVIVVVIVHSLPDASKKTSALIDLKRDLLGW
jgi:hypothetical protein